MADAPAAGSSEFTDKVEAAKPKGPFFIDDGGCGCALQDKLEKDAWRCMANATQSPYEGDTGKWFYAVNQADPESLTAPVNSNSNPPDTSLAYEIREGQFWSYPEDDLSTRQDVICTGENATDASAQAYKDLEKLESGEGLPCLQPGTMPLQIQSREQWDVLGCLPGFFCKHIASRRCISIKMANISKYDRPK